MEQQGCLQVIETLLSASSVTALNQERLNGEQTGAATSTVTERGLF